MKKILFGLLAVVMTAFNVNAQQNTANKLDFVGKIHNEILADFIKQSSGKKLTNDEVLKLVQEITLKNNDYASRYASDYKGLTNDQVEQGISDFPNQFENTVNELKISDETKRILNELLNETFKTDEKGMDYNRYYAYVVNLEEKTIASELPETEKNLILSAASVARHSGYFWTESKDAPEGKKHFGWVIGGDIVGGILGFFFGGGGGAISGAAGGSSLVHTINESK